MATRVMFDVPAVRALDVLTDPATATGITVVGADSGKVFCNPNSSGKVTYTLPSLVNGTGKVFWFVQSGAGTTAITAPSACMIANDATATTNTASAQLAAWCMVTCDGTSYYCFEGSGTWTTS